MSPLRRAPALLLGLMTLTACERPAPTLPRGRMTGDLALGDHQAAIVLADLSAEEAVLAVVDDRGTPRWAARLPIAGYDDLHREPDLAVTDDLVLLAGPGVYAYDRASGQRRWHHPAPADEHGIDVTVADGRILVPGPTRLDALDPATGEILWSVVGPERTDLAHLSADYVARTTDLTRWVRATAGFTAQPDAPTPRERLEVVHGPTGEIVWSSELGDHCTIGATVLGAAADGGLLALDLAATPPSPRTVAPAGLLHAPSEWRLSRCIARGDTWWIQQVGPGGASLIHAVDPRTGARLRRQGLCSVVALAGRHVLLYGSGHTELKAFDLDRDVATWRQDQAIHRPDYIRPTITDDLVFVTTDPGELQHVVAFDPATGEITGAVALRGARRFHPAAADDHWLASAEFVPRGPAPVAPLARRELLLLGPAPPRVDVVDNAAEVRASLRPIDESGAQDLRWDPTWLAGGPRRRHTCMHDRWLVDGPAATVNPPTPAADDP